MSLSLDGQIRSYEKTLHKLARPLVGRNGAEADDLVQEGRVFVWQSLEKGIKPALEMIENRMKDYIRWLGRKSAIPYEAMLPIDIVGESNFDPDMQRARRGGGTIQGRPAQFRRQHGTPLLADGS